MRKKIKTDPNTKFLPIFNGLNNNSTENNCTLLYGRGFGENRLRENVHFSVCLMILNYAWSTFFIFFDLIFF